jgi:hypothetical protein
MTEVTINRISGLSVKFAKILFNRSGGRGRTALAMVRGHDISISRWFSCNMGVGKDVESFGTNRIDTVAVVEAEIIVEKIVQGVDRQVFKIIILFVC